MVDPIDGTIMVHLSGKEQMRTNEYIGLVLWFTVLALPLQYYVGSIGWHLERLGDDDGTMTNAFAMVYGLAALFAPVGGLVADKFGLGVTMAFAACGWVEFFRVRVRRNEYRVRSAQRRFSFVRGR